MPIVKMPDGVNVRFDDDMTDEQIRNVILKSFPDAEKQANVEEQKIDVSKLSLKDVMSDEDGLNSKPMSKLDLMWTLANLAPDSVAKDQVDPMLVAARAIKNTDYGKLVPEAAKSVGRQTSDLVINRMVGSNIEKIGVLLKDNKTKPDDFPKGSIMYHKTQFRDTLANGLIDFGKHVRGLSERLNDSDILQADEELFEGSFTENPNLNKAADLAMSGVSSLVGMYAVGKYVNPAMSLFLFSGADADDIFWEALEAGKSKLKALSMWFVTTVGTAVAEKYGAEKVFGMRFGKDGMTKIVEASKKTSQKIVEGMIGEGGEELVQNTFQNFVKKIGYNEAQDLFENGLESFLGGALGGGLVSSFNYGYQAFKEKADKYGLSDQERNQIIGALGQGVANKPDLVEMPLQENMKKAYDSFEKMIEKLGDSPEAARLRETKQALDEGYQKYYEQLKEFRPEQEAKANAALIRSAALYFSELEGMSVKDWFEQKAPKITRLDNLETKAKEFIDNLTPTKLTIDEQEVNLFDALKNPDIVKKYRKKDERKSLTQFIKSRGGVKDVGGDLKAMGLIKQAPGLINNKSGESLDDIAMAAWENGYFKSPDRPTVNDLLEAIRNESFGNKRYAEEKEQNIADYVDNLAQQLDMLGIDYANMSAQEAERAYNQAVEEYSAQREQAEQAEDFETIPFFQESLKLAEENARLDEQYPAYDGETIDINGVDRTVYNSEGERIAKSAEALRNFYKWFGDSKVVDEQGRPKVVYHGTKKAGFRVFDKGKQGSNTGNVDDGFFFGDRSLAKTYTTNYAEVREEDTDIDEYGEQPEFSGMYAVYLKMSDPEIWDFQGASWDGFAYGKYAIYDEQDYMWLEDEDNNHAFRLFDSYQEAESYLEEKGGSYRDGDSVEDRGKETEYTIKKDPQLFDTTRELANEAKLNGMDGLIIKNINDTGGYGYGGEEGDIYVAFEPEQIKSTSNRGTFSKDNPDIFYQFAGQKAQTAALDELNNAKQLEADGVDNEQIRQQTGWFKGVDGKWRFEISDKDAEFNEGYNIDKWKENGIYFEGLNFKLGKILKHDKLFAAYPELKDVNIEYERRRTSDGTLGTFSQAENKIYISSQLNGKQVLSVIMHELQHAIQHKEGFAKGGSPDEFASIEELRNGLEQAKEHLRQANEALETADDLGYSDETLIDDKPVSYYKELKQKAQEQIDYANEKLKDYKEPFEAYQSLAGEVEARNTQARMDMSEEERKAATPESTQDVSNADAIVVFDDGTAMAYQPEAKNETFYQSAFAGSRVDYDRPSLEAIGSGEGNQAHGWGLYYALNKGVAEKYRISFTFDDKINDLVAKHQGLLRSVAMEVYNFGKYNTLKEYKKELNKLKRKKNIDEETEKNILGLENTIKSIETITDEEIDAIRNNKGQVHEVDIPENPYLLDENKSYENQSDYVKEKLQEFFKDKQVLDLIKGEKGKYTKSQIKFFFENKSEDYSKVRELNELLFGTKTSETTPENARLLSELLYKHGIKGITYDGRQDGRCFVIFNPADVKVIQKFYQGESNPLGAYSNRIIYLNRTANASTLPHELAHFWSDELRQSNSIRAKEILKQADRWEESEFERKYSIKEQDGKYIVTDKAGQTVYDKMGEGFETADKAKAYAKEELFARGFEQYIREGKAPNQTLRVVFRNFFNWLKKIYHDMMALDIKLSNPMRNLYAEILGGTKIDTFLSQDVDQFIETRKEVGKERVKQVQDIIDQAIQMPKKTAWQKVKQAYKDFDFSKTWTDIAVPLSTRAKRIAPTFRNKLRHYVFDLLNNKRKYYEELEPMFKKWKGFSPEDATAFDLALKNNVPEIRDELLNKYDAVEDFQKIKQVLEKIYIDAENAGMDVGYIEDYFPRKVKDVDGLLAYLQGTDEWSSFQEARRKEDPNNKFDAEEQAEFIDKYLRGIVRVDPSAYKYNSEKARKLDTIDNGINQFYEGSMQALINYIEGMNARIEVMKFFGRNDNNVDDSIGAFIGYMLDTDQIKPSQVDEVKKILTAVFKSRGVSSRWIKSFRDASYIYTMGGFNTAITQLDDIFVSMYKSGVLNTIEAIRDTNKITKKDIGLDSIAAEFMEGSGTSKAVNWVFKHNGIEFIDSIGKNTLLNGVMKKMQKMSDEKLRNYLEPIMEEETENTLNDIRSGELSDNVRFFLFNELSDMQPISLIEMPETYNTGGNRRIFYMLKSFMLKRIDTLRNECFDKIKSDKKTEKIEGLRNLYVLTLLMMAGGATKDFIIDFLYARAIDLKDTLVNNLLGIVGISKYNIYQVREEGFNHTIVLFTAPPLFQIVDDLTKDVDKMMKGKRKLKDFEVLKGFPVVGRFYYWWFGGGREKTKKKMRKKKKR